MGKFDKEYYFIVSSGNDANPMLTPDENTEGRAFRYEAQLIGSPPLVFFNGSFEYQRKNKIPSMKISSCILLSGSNLVIPGSIRDVLLELEIPNLHMHPVAYKHDDKKWYEDYWFMAFSERFDCWDRKFSHYDQEAPPIELGGFVLEQVYSYSLNDELLEKTPLRNRLLFQMGGDLSAFFVCHKSLLKLFNGSQESIHLISIGDF
ncbi:hypothetical protein IGS61_26815 [Janthinobacterium sp. FW305-129]|uniref:hypothetical protein n=1 Tax=Janthinobacterium sp. FW305-129 TaxID=2775054 RepID=UPI001E559FF3|nr:hypothetical protein [Janthinobacterium sp. FW305-129]MCC7601128.1 hypothetical protein [Janthinobacterium sp. FW305-129]